MLKWINIHRPQGHTVEPIGIIINISVLLTILCLHAYSSEVVSGSSKRGKSLTSAFS
jgi:hypothetical protein